MQGTGGRKTRHWEHEDIAGNTPGPTLALSWGLQFNGVKPRQSSALAPTVKSRLNHVALVELFISIRRTCFIDMPFFLLLYLSRRYMDTL